MISGHWSFADVYAGPLHRLHAPRDVPLGVDPRGLHCTVPAALHERSTVRQQFDCYPNTGEPGLDMCQTMGAVLTAFFRLSSLVSRLHSRSTPNRTPDLLVPNIKRAGCRFIQS